MQKINVLDLSPDESQSYFLRLGEKTYRANQMLRWVHRFGYDNFNNISEFSLSLRKTLNEQTEVKPPRVLWERVAHDETRKWLLQLDCNNCIETVFIPEKNRGTLCVSSQVGCALACQFCSTARQGFNRDLTVSEIIGQLWIATKRLRELNIRENPITNVVFMGMGEPFLNFENVMKAITLMRHDCAYGLSKYKITVSTSGIVPRIIDFMKLTDVCLAISLHAPTDELRNQLVPVNRKYNLNELMQACRTYFPSQGKREVTFEYVMLDGVNDQREHAKKLVSLVHGVAAKINLIPFNTFPGVSFSCTPMNKIHEFQKYLMQHGLQTNIRKTRGDDMDAACGQLVGQVKARSKFKTIEKNKIRVTH